MIGPISLSDVTAFIVATTLIYMPHSRLGLPPPHPMVLTTVELGGGGGVQGRIPKQSWREANGTGEC